jgi:hypothetical protein
MSGKLASQELFRARGRVLADGDVERHFSSELERLTSSLGGLLDALARIA